MNANFSVWSIRKPVPAILLFAVLCVMGLISVSQLPVTRFPNIDVPLVSVTAIGLAPKYVACEQHGRYPGIAGFVGGQLGLPPEWTDKGAKQAAQ